jgi:hypothetical protein
MFERHNKSVLQYCAFFLYWLSDKTLENYSRNKELRREVFGVEPGNRNIHTQCFYSRNYRTIVGLKKANYSRNTVLGVKCINYSRNYKYSIVHEGC